MSDKEPQLLAAIAYLRGLIGDGAMVIADHWSADRTAIGVEHADYPGMLAYIALRSPGHFDILFEHPPTSDSDPPHQPAGGAEMLRLQDLGIIVAQFLCRERT